MYIRTYATANARSRHGRQQPLPRVRMAAEPVIQASVPSPKGAGDAAKEQGNAHFKAKEYLKAAVNWQAKKRGGATALL